MGHVNDEHGWCCDGRTWEEHNSEGGDCCQSEGTSLEDLPEEGQQKARDRMEAEEAGPQPTEANTQNQDASPIPSNPHDSR